MRRLLESPRVMARQRAHLRYRGKVQGVGFRDHARRAAERAGVRGWVRNLPDGTVECVVEGEVSEIRIFIEGVQSDMSRFIASHDVVFEDATDEFSAFTVRF